MDLSPTYLEKQEVVSLLIKHLSSRDSALAIGNSSTDLFWIEGMGFKNLVGIDTLHTELFEHYVGHHKAMAEIHGERFDPKPLNRMFRSKYNFILGDISTHNFREQKFDCIFCGLLLEDVSFETQASLMKIIGNLLRSHGIALIRIGSATFTKQETEKLFSLINCEIMDAREKNDTYRVLLKKK